ncbi:MAG: response regulator transcription factor [Actinobacteria bacterium]|nr:response regulator transcription factor [Actinomycetota bacterium]MCL5025510.1 response regulator transcription factor [Chloroflexota bacterium]
MLVRFPLLLVVDDDPTILRSLQVNLEADGFDIMTASTAREALEKTQQKLPDLAIVDLLLPDMHGFQLCQELKRYLDLPVVLLTAVDTEESVTDGLDLYAEDYVVKPFSYRQLLARINRVLKRTRHLLPESQIVVIDKELSIDFARHVAVLNGVEIRLTPVESRLLSALARNLNRVVRDEMLLDEGWPDGEGDPCRLWVNVRRLRLKLEANPDEPKRLITARQQGYKLQAGL